MTSIRLENLQIITSDMSETLSVYGGSLGELVIFIFRQHRHYIIYAKFEETNPIRLAKILGKNNHILLVDNEGSSFLISISDEYLKRSSFEFTIAKQRDFFRVRRIVSEKGNIKVAWVCEGKAVSQDIKNVYSKYLFDDEGNIYSMVLEEDYQAELVSANDMASYLRTHNFEFKTSTLLAFRSLHLEQAMKAAQNTIMVVEVLFRPRLIQCWKENRNLPI